MAVPEGARRVAVPVRVTAPVVPPPGGVVPVSPTNAPLRVSSGELALAAAAGAVVSALSATAGRAEPGAPSGVPAATGSLVVAAVGLPADAGRSAVGEAPAAAAPTSALPGEPEPRDPGPVVAGLAERRGALGEPVKSITPATVAATVAATDIAARARRRWPSSRLRRRLARRRS